MEDPKNKQNPDERLSQLLKMKKLERPDAEFWETFDSSLRSRQLSALVRTQSWYQRAWKLASIIARKSAPTVATVSAFTLAFVAVNKSEFFVEESDSSAVSNNHAQIEESQPMFVVDAENDMAPDVVPQPNISANQVYAVQALTRDNSSESYQLLALPKSFTAPKSANESGAFGAKVIRASSQF